MKGADLQHISSDDQLLLGEALAGAEDRQEGELRQVDLQLGEEALALLQTVRRAVPLRQ